MGEFSIPREDSMGPILLHLSILTLLLETIVVFDVGNFVLFLLCMWGWALPLWAKKAPPFLTLSTCTNQLVKVEPMGGAGGVFPILARSPTYTNIVRGQVLGTGCGHVQH